MTITGDIKRGNIVYITLDPQAGYEQGGRRPALMVSDGIIDPGELSQKFAVIVPITNTDRGYPFHIPVPEGIPIHHPEHGDTVLRGYAMCEQVKSLDMNRRNAYVAGQVDPKSDFYKHVIITVRSIFA